MPHSQEWEEGGQFRLITWVGQVVRNAHNVSSVPTFTKTSSASARVARDDIKPFDLYSKEETQKLVEKYWTVMLKNLEGTST